MKHEGGGAGDGDGVCRTMKNDMAKRRYTVRSAKEKFRI
jgi:hypothetical protein